jgi:3-hydroxymyristoyl/3-hydroxydecanoyl-(acyl carrier protein) dehydratase
MNMAHPSPPAASFTIAADHPALPGHFPGRPIVPGVVLLDHAILRIAEALGRPIERFEIGAAKFLATVSPGECVRVDYAVAASGTIRFSLEAGGRTVASGTLSLADATTGGEAAEAPT